MKNSFKTFGVMTIAALSFGVSLNVIAQESYSQSQSSLTFEYNPQAANSIPTKKVDPQLLGQVQPGIPPVISQSEQGLQEIRDTISKTKRVLGSIIKEVQRVQVFDTPTPVDMDETFMDPTLQSDYYYPMQPASFAGPRSGEPLPARRKWMDYYASELNQLMPLLNNDAAALVLPEQGAAPITAQMGVMKDSVRQIQTDYVQLKAAMVGPSYDNQYIARLAEALRDDLCGVDSVRKHMLRIVQTDKKQSAKTF